VRIFRLPLLFLFLIFPCANISSMDTNYTAQNSSISPDIVPEILTPDEIDDLVDFSIQNYESEALTPEELFWVYSDVLRSTQKNSEISEIIINFEPQTYSPPATKLEKRIAGRKIPFLESVQQRRMFMDDAHKTLGDTRWIRRPKKVSISLPALLQNYCLQAFDYLGIAAVPPRKTADFLQNLAKSKVLEIRNAIIELKNKFYFDGNFRESAKCYRKIGHFETEKCESNRWWKPWTWSRHYYAIEKLSDHVIASTYKTIRKKDLEEEKIKQEIKNALEKKSREKLVKQEELITQFKQIKDIVLEYNSKDSKKLLKRTNAAHAAIENNFEKQEKNHVLNNSSQKYISIYMDPKENLESYSGNEIQQNVHGEIVDFLNKYSCYLDTTKNKPEEETNLFEAANIALGLRDKIDSTQESLEICKRTYSFLDFCNNLLKVKVCRTVFYLTQRIGQGFEKAKFDIQNFLKNGLKKYVDSTYVDSTYFDFGKTANLEETIGDALELFSRTLVYASAAIVAATTITLLAESVAALTAGVTALTAAKNTFEPLITPDGTAALGGTTSVPIWQIITNSVCETTQILSGLVESAYALRCGGWGGGPKKTPFEIAKDGGKHSGFLENYKNKPTSELEAGIKSLKKQIKRHEDCIQNPTEYYPNFYELDPREQEHLIRIKWPGDILRQKEHLNILEQLLQEAMGDKIW